MDQLKLYFKNDQHFIIKSFTLYYLEHYVKSTMGTNNSAIFL